MDVEFINKRVKKECSSEKAMKGRWGPMTAKKLKRRLADIEAAKTLADMRHLPGRCHELVADRAGQLAVDLDHPRRLIFKPNHHPVPIRAAGGLDWAGVTGIVVLEITDYH